MVVLATICVVALVLDSLRLFGSPLLASLIRLETNYYYALIGLLLPFSFLLYRSNTKFDLLIVDILLACAAAYCCFWFFGRATEIVEEGWEFVAPEEAVRVVSFCGCWSLKPSGGLAAFPSLPWFCCFPSIRWLQTKCLRCCPEWHLELPKQLYITP